MKEVSCRISLNHIAEALVVLSKKIAQLYYLKSIAKDKEEEKKIQANINEVLRLRNFTLVRVLNMGKAKIVKIVKTKSECLRVDPIYVDTVTGKELNVNRFILFPNMKYCKVPKKGKTLDLNNVNYRGEYRIENSKTIINKNYIVEFKGHNYAIPASYMDMVKPKFKGTDEDFPVEMPETITRPTPTNVEIDEVEYKKAIYLLYYMVYKEKRRKRRYNEKLRKIREAEEAEKRRLKQEKIDKMNATIKAKAERRAKLEAEKAKLEAEKAQNAETATTPDTPNSTETKA
jgi:hypothetical protein